MRRPIPAAKKQQSIGLLTSGQSARSVSESTGISRSVLSNLATIKGINITCNRGGRPRRLSPSDVKILARAVSTSKVRTCSEGVKLVKKTLDRDVSTQTIRRSLRGIGFRAIVKKRKPALKLAHRQARLKFAKRYADFTVEDWKRVIWSDETKINRFGSDGCRWTWRSPGAAKGVINVKKHKMRKDGVIFQQDNDPKHTSKKAQACLEELRVGLMLLEWPAQSPDLNPIEHLWTHLKRKLAEYPEPAGGVEELWERMNEEWGKIPADVVLRLIESIPHRVQAVLRAKVGHTKY